MEITIRWKQKAVNQFADAIKYIEKDSPLNAEKSEKEILKKIDNLLFQPERYQPDKFKKNNDGSYRAFEVFSYRISYRYISNQIRIFRIRYTKMSPLNY
jgi:plasmid stabilization system protein ParE